MFPAVAQRTSSASRWHKTPAAVLGLVLASRQPSLDIRARCTIPCMPENDCARRTQARRSWSRALLIRLAREGAFGDYSQAPRKEQPNRANVIRVKDS